MISVNALVVPDATSPILHLDNSTEHPQTHTTSSRLLLEFFLVLGQRDKQLHHLVLFILEIVREARVRRERYMRNSVISNPNEVAGFVLAEGIPKDDIMIALEIEGASDITRMLDIAHFVKVPLDLGLVDGRREGGIARMHDFLGLLASVLFTRQQKARRPLSDLHGL